MNSTEQHRYLPGLDGLRAVAVALVVVFHAELGWLPGGFVGVSVFFTLSGFLITSVLLRELEAHDHVRLRRFWTKRARRLVPASIVCFAAVCVWSLVSKSAQTGPGLRWDVLSALGNVANWRFALTGKTYADLFAGPSPLLHTWSLSIEEQFYLLFPLLFAALWRLGLRRAGCAVVLSVLTVASGVAAWAVGSDEVAYYGTHTRCGEILLGAVIALVAGDRLRARSEAIASPRAGRATMVVGLAALAALSAVARAGSPGNHAIVHGGLALFAVASGALLFVAMVPGPIRTALSAAPLRWIGQRSYGIYLYHWPILLWVKGSRFGHLGWRSFAVAMALTLLVSTLSYRVIEQPVRRVRWPRPGTRGRIGYIGAIGSCALLASSVTSASAATSLLQEAQSGPPTIVTFSAPPPTVDVVATPTTLPPPARVLVLGTDLSLAARLTGRVDDANVDVVDRATLSCTALATEGFTHLDGHLTDSHCPRQIWEASIAANHPAAVVVGLSAFERLAYRLADGTVVGTDPASADLRRAGLAELVGFLDHLDVPTYLFDALAELPDQPDQPDQVADTLATLLAVTPSVTQVSAADLDEVITAVTGEEGATSVPRSTLRVLVVGDSTAYALAEGLAAGSDGALTVISAGVIRCPVVHAVRTRGGPGVDSPTTDCLWFDTDWPRLVDAYDADVVLNVTSLTEQWAQQYPGDPQWHAPGSAEYDAFHDSELAALTSSLRAIGVPLLLTDAPELRRDIGGYYGNDPTSIAAWNAVIQRWDLVTPDIKVVPFAQFFSDPDGEAGRAERPDGVHVTRAFAEQLTREHLLGAIQSAYDRAIADIRQAG